VRGGARHGPDARAASHLSRTSSPRQCLNAFPMSDWSNGRSNTGREQTEQRQTEQRQTEQRCGDSVPNSSRPTEQLRSQIRPPVAHERV
jgi:hypothetical protein